ncbi:MAG TPA: hypothetical protein PLC48_00030 [Ferruginibacter sp.]|nr:hypothetical protein [Ferruginibacter sp.]
MEHSLSTFNKKTFIPQYIVWIIAGIFCFLISATGLLLVSTQKNIDPLTILTCMGAQVLVLFVAFIIHEWRTHHPS